MKTAGSARLGSVQGSVHGLPTVGQSVAVSQPAISKIIEESCEPDDEETAVAFSSLIQQQASEKQPAGAGNANVMKDSAHLLSFCNLFAT
jgi:hypothetical protein